MRKLTTLILMALVIATYSATAWADNPICNVKSETDLVKALANPPTDAGGQCGNSTARTISIDGPITVTATVKIPDNTILFSFDTGHPFLRQTITATKQFAPSGSAQCMIELGKGVTMYGLQLTTETEIQTALCVNGNSTVKNITIDGKWIQGFFRGIDVDAPAVLLENNISVQSIGILANKTAALLRNKIFTNLANASGIYFQAAPLMVLNNELYEEGGVYFPTAEGTKFPLGVAANILKLNGMPKSNFFDVYKILQTGLIACNTPLGYNPYKADGSCASYVFDNETPIATCPTNQAKLPDGSCGCPDPMKLDAASGLCFVEKVVEKPVEVIVEKPVTGEAAPLPATPPTPTPMTPIVANPGDGGSDCSLIPDRVVSALTPVGMLLLIIGLIGVAAYRYRLEAERIRKKKF